MLLCLCGRWHFPVPTAQVDKTRSFGCQLPSFWSWLVSHRGCWECLAYLLIHSRSVRVVRSNYTSELPRNVRCWGRDASGQKWTTKLLGFSSWSWRFLYKENQRGREMLILIIMEFQLNCAKTKKEGKSLKHWKLLNFCICLKKLGLAFKIEFEAALGVSGRDVAWSAHKKRYMNSTQLSYVCIEHRIHV